MDSPSMSDMNLDEHGLDMFHAQFPDSACDSPAVWQQNSFGGSAADRAGGGALCGAVPGCPPLGASRLCSVFK